MMIDFHTSHVFVLELRLAPRARRLLLQRADRDARGEHDRQYRTHHQLPHRNPHEYGNRDTDTETLLSRDPNLTAGDLMM